MRCQYRTELTNEARAEISLLNLCLARRKKTIVNRITFKELEEWVNDPLDDDVQCLEIEKKVYSKPSDDQVWLLIKEQTGATSGTTFQQLADEIKRNILRILKAAIKREQ